MDEQSINEACRSIVALLEQRRLKEAQAQLQALMPACGNYLLQSRLEEVATTYRYMLQYMRQGIEDESRYGLHVRLCADTWEIADQARLLLLDNVPASGYYRSLRRACRLSPQVGLEKGLRMLEAFSDELSLCRLMAQDHERLNATLKQHEKTNEELFLCTWANSGWRVEEAESAQKFLASELLGLHDLCLFTSAVTLSLLSCFDARKMKWLLDAARHASQQVAQRALVGCVLALLVHPSRLQLYPDLMAQLELGDEDGHLGRNLNQIYIQLLRSLETEEIDRKMREEIIPEMMKNVNLMRNMKFGFEENGEENDMNPDWEKSFGQSGLDDKLREMNELQLEGSDVYMSTFSQLKNYPFFRSLPNWFYPFDMAHSSMVREFGLALSEGNSVLAVLLQSGFFCDSDKYSLAFTMARIPQAQRNAMLSQMTSQDIGEMMDESRRSGFKQYAERADVISNLYIHDLYRFFKLNPQRRELPDIFCSEIALHRIPALSPLLHKPGLMKAVADFLFRKGHPEKALSVYREVAAAGAGDADLFQKAGYCLQKGKRYREAVEAYLKADMLKPDHLWTIRHLATCYRLAHDFPQALEYYRKAEAIQPDNRSVLFHAGSCLAGLERYDEALQYFFRLDLMDSSDVKAWRAIAWCSFAAGKTGQAANYYGRILAGPAPLAADYLNAGHVAWKQGNVAQAASLYGKAVRQSESLAAFFDLFNKDKEILAKAGLPVADMPLMLDLALED